MSSAGSSVDALDCAPAPASQTRQGVIDRIALWLVSLAVLYTAASYLGTVSWWLELLTHFRLQAAAGSLVLVLFSVARRSWLTFALAALVVSAQAIPLLPYIGPNAAAAGTRAPELRIMVANVSKRNTDYAALREVIDRESPDIVGLLEANGAWISELANLEGDYPNTVLRPQDGAYGLAVYSRFPLREQAISPYSAGGIQTAIIADLDLHGSSATLFLAHLMAPIGASEAKLRNRQIDEIVQLVSNDLNEEQILIGDLNITPWSPFYTPLERDTGLANAALGRGYHSTWPAGIRMLRIPIDHCLLSDGLAVSDVRTGPGFGSDHLPLLVDVALDAG